MGRPGQMMRGAGGIRTVRAQDARATVRRLAGELAPERWWLGLAIALGIVAVGLMVLGPRILGNATNQLFSGLVGSHLPAGATKAQAVAGLRAHGESQIADMVAGMQVVPGQGVDLGALGRTLALAALTYAVGAGFTFVQGYTMAGVTQRTMYRLRREVEEKLDRLPLRYFDRHAHGDVLSRVTNDIDNLTTTLQQGLSQLLTSSLTVIGVLVMMFLISPLLAGISLVIIPLALVTTLLVARRAQVHFNAQWERTGDLNGLVEETHTGHLLVQAFGRRPATVETFRDLNRHLFESSFRAQFLSGLIQPTMMFLANLNYVVIAVLGGYRVAQGALGLGDVQAFIQYSRQFTMPITQIASQMNMLQSGLASAERVFEILDEEEEPADLVVSAHPVATGRVAFDRVSFRYAPDEPLIEEFTLDVAPGKTVAIVGPTGAGKTTIVNLLVRFYEVDGGAILLDGISYAERSRREVRRAFGMVLQDTWLFAGTIADNIAYGRPGAAEEEIAAAARAAHADAFIRTLPDGYETVLDEDAANISAGEKQLLTIARAFLANPSVLILDEATSNVDTRTEVLIQQAMGRLRRNRTSFVIAHRLSTIRDADTIVVMDHGRIVEQGDHATLIARGGRYAELYASQFTEAVDKAG